MCVCVKYLCYSKYIHIKIYMPAYGLKFEGSWKYIPSLHYPTVSLPDIYQAACVWSVDEIFSFMFMFFLPSQSWSKSTLLWGSSHISHQHLNVNLFLSSPSIWVHGTMGFWHCEGDAALFEAHGGWRNHSWVGCWSLWIRDMSHLQLILSTRCHFLGELGFSVKEVFTQCNCQVISKGILQNLTG